MPCVRYIATSILGSIPEKCLTPWKRRCRWDARQARNVPFAFLASDETSYIGAVIEVSSGLIIGSLSDFSR